jgi:hypothetical protein
MPQGRGSDGRRRRVCHSYLDQGSDVQAVIDKFGPSDVSKITADFNPEMAAYYRADSPMLAYFAGQVSTAANPWLRQECTARVMCSMAPDMVISPSWGTPSQGYPGRRGRAWTSSFGFSGPRWVRRSARVDNRAFGASLPVGRYGVNMTQCRS